MNHSSQPPIIVSKKYYYCGKYNLHFLPFSVPEVWAEVDISTSTTETPQEVMSYTLFCTVDLNIVLPAQPVLVWHGPDGTPMHNESDIIVGATVIVGSEARSSLNFRYLNSSHGGNYHCYVSIQVPYLNLTLTNATTTLLFPVSHWLLSSTEKY